jgi:hypothetical protein
VVVVVVVIVVESFVWVVYVRRGKGFGFGVLTTRVVGRLSSMTQCGILVYWVRAPR